MAFLVRGFLQETVVGCRRFRHDTVQNSFARMVRQYLFKLRVQGVHGARQMFEEKTPRRFKIYCTVDPGRFARSVQVVRRPYFVGDFIYRTRDDIFFSAMRRLNL